MLFSFGVMRSTVRLAALPNTIDARLRDDPGGKIHAGNAANWPANHTILSICRSRFLVTSISGCACQL
ncbi:MAG: hypothetical protein A4S15_01855 [Candidatus Raskinella chloraquaticus]|uniref:Uncharacterized protein n=1 Tax=Candidatus Raskinella chloraquaticus TaxID=1951219 RepID=A0A1W9HQH6_9HYPH|nr:MAG: hypothetical protein A4S15_01855 [Proteobacteria bacterium SG_bin8]